MTKEEKIKEAYGEDYKFINEFLIGNGFFDGECDDFIHLRRKLYKNGGVEIKIIDEVQFVRPKSLQGIEDNNGWVNVESKNDLPKDSYNYWVFCSDGCVRNLKDFEYYENYIMPELEASHYQPIEKPKPPVY